MPSYKNTKYVDMQKFCAFRKNARQRYYKKTAEYGKGKRRWTTEEDEQVLSQNVTDFELAQKIKRSVKAIQTRRYKLRKKE